ncbi:MAG: ATP-binding protein [Agathobacter sp.]|nr:ATP-binding protein [Agathobacter sp.]
MFKQSELKKLEDLYAESGNQLFVLYGPMNCEKEELIRTFISDKKYFYYRARKASAKEQLSMMGEEVSKKFDVRLQKYTYDEYFNRVKSGNPTKLVVVIDEFEQIAKKDPEFMESILKLKNRRLYPGPVMIILASSSIVWAEQDMDTVIGEDIAKKIDARIKIPNLNFLEVVRVFPEFSVSETIKVYGVLGGVPGYLKHWNTKKSFKQNVCDLILSENGYFFKMAEELVSSELRELSVYNTILMAIAKGENKLNDLFHYTGYSRPKISVYMKNLSHFDIIEKVVSFETGGWDNAKKGVYRIKDTYINFYYRFVYPHLSDLYMMSPEEFYDTYIESELDEYLNRYFINVCMEYLSLLNQIRRLPLVVSKMGTWVGKTGNIDIIAQSSDRQNIVGTCNWEKPELTMDMCRELFDSMKKAKITSKHIYLFSAKAFAPDVIEMAKADSRFELIDMNEL